MNSKTRVRTALKHQEPDRVPIGEWGIDHDIVERVIGRATFWRSRNQSVQAFWAGRREEVVESYKRDLVELVEVLDYDLVPVHLVPPKDPPPQDIKRTEAGDYEDAYGQRWQYSAGNDSLLLLSRPKRQITSEEDLIKLFETEFAGRCGFKILGKDDDGSYRLALADESRLELVRHIIARLGDSRFIFARGFEDAAGNIEPLYFSEWEAVWWFFGGSAEDLYVALAWQPNLVKKAFALCTEINLAMAREFISAGVDAIMPGGDFASSSGPLISPRAIRDLFLPGMKKLVDLAHQSGVPTLTHNCGNNWLIMDLLVEAGYDAWQSIQSKTGQMDLKKLKTDYGAQLALWGGINIETLCEGAPEENRQDVLYALKHAAPGGGFILGTSNSVCYGSSYENYRAALDCLRLYGRYPIEL